jgi:methylated-DNA-[protein]-cysteine S-methyltransferase
MQAARRQGPGSASRSDVFRGRVLSVVRRIPPGRVATYGDVAAAAGNGRASRAVGNIMRNCRSQDVPCHRVVAAGGRLGGYGGNLEMKRALLRAEGVRVAGGTIKDFDVRRWTNVRRPVRRSAKRQGPPPPQGYGATSLPAEARSAKAGATRAGHGDV